MKNVNLREIEKKILDFWENKKLYKYKLDSKKKIYSIDTPPPTVSGKMHIGHAFSYSQQDFIARYKRMKGFNVFYPFGTDDNGLATEKLVQKQKNVNLRRVSREDSIKICMEFLKEERPKFIQDWRNIGVSCDFDVLYSTIDDNSRKISQKSFLDLAKKKLVYREWAPILWDTAFQTAIAQAELKDKEVESYFNDLIFKTEDGEEVIIATTRPELLYACVAVFINPHDRKNKRLIGKKLITPLYGISVPVMADEKVDMEKGTGIVMCCTFGDRTDVEWYKKHKLPLKMAINYDGTMTPDSGYSGMKIIDARKVIINNLKEAGLLKSQKKIIHVVQVGERSDEPIEIISSIQWYVKYLNKKETFLKASKELNWYPKYMKHKLDNWIKGLGWDWSISRQRHFGVPIPVWYCKKCGETIFAEERQLPIDPVKDKPLKKCNNCKSSEFIPEKDVFDTWFTSASTPDLAISLVPEKERKKLFPMSLRPQAQDIINFWLFYTMAKSQLLKNENPWNDVSISGFVTMKGEKMSKSKGNIIEPQKIVENFGADAMRYWAAASKLGEDMEYQEKELVTGNRLVSKILNSSNFIFMNIKSAPKKRSEFLDIDRMFLVRLNELILDSTKNFDNYEFHKVKSEVDKFFWNEFCGDYLEIVKWRVYNGNEKEKESAFFVLYNSLLVLMKLFAPIMPFITEEIYQRYFKKNEKGLSIHISQWPEEFDIKEKKGDKEVFNLLLEIIGKVRSEKSKSKKAMNSEIILTLDKEEKKKLKDVLKDLKNVTNSKEIKEGKFNVDFV